MSLWSTTRFARIVGFCAFVALPAFGAEPATQTQPPRDFAAMRSRIDELLARNWQQAGIEPAPPASDAEFIRRASLDLTGRLPSIDVTRSFLADETPDKRLRLIDALVERPSHATRLASVWTGFLLPRENAVQYFQGPAQFQFWLREKFAANVAYDHLAREILLASGQFGQVSPVSFYLSRENKPEALASAVSRSFLGVQLECAQCHQHPFDAWTQRDFWGFAAFFAQLGGGEGQRVGAFELNDSQRGEVRLPGTNDIVPPRLLGAADPMPASVSSGGEKISRRQQLADWLCSPENPYFARAAVNRVWALLFGRGLVHPVDNFSDRHPPSHPELLDELTEYFVQSKFDVRLLVRTLAGTQAYGRSSGAASAAQANVDPNAFARMAIKTLTAEQLYDSLADATLRRQGNALNPAAAGFNAESQARQQFLAKFRDTAAGAEEYQGGIPQALALMNGPLVIEATDPERSDILVELRAPYFSDADRLEIVFLAALARYPADAERTALLAHLESQPDAAAKQKALGDLVWAILNSAEFALNH